MRQTAIRTDRRGLTVWFSIETEIGRVHAHCSGLQRSALFIDVTSPVLQTQVGDSGDDVCWCSVRALLCDGV